MNITKFKKWLHCLLALTLIISGMGFETVKINSSSLYTVNSTDTCSFYLPKNTEVNQDICTPEELNPTSLRCAGETLNRNSVGNRSIGVRTGLFLSTLNILSENSNFYFIDEYNRTNRTISPADAAIITYIHQQDGAKG